MASLVESINASAAAFPAQFHATIASVNTAGLLTKVSDNATPTNVFILFLTLFAAAVVYDQCKSMATVRLAPRNTN
jgi:C-22 sterol desaturase